MAGGMKKEAKKLAKTIKAHRKRLEGLLSAAAVPTSQLQQTPMLAPTQQQQLSRAELHAVLAELAQLQTALSAVRQQQRRMAAMCDTDSSDSDDDCCAAPHQQVSSGMITQQQQQQQREGMRQLQTCSPAATTAPRAAMGSSTCLQQAPLIDQEQPGLVQQLPPPQQYTATGRVLVCQGKACMRKGALQVLQAASHATAASPGVEVLPCKCLGKCKQAPAMRVRTDQQPRSSLVTEIEALEVPEILDELLGSPAVVEA
jgi:(2Fe-2S) ferredoxin